MRLERSYGLHRTGRCAGTTTASTVALVALLLGLVLGACRGPSGGGQLPAAETPVVESVLDVDHRLNAVFHQTDTGAFVMLPGRGVELRLRAPYLTTISLEFNDSPLPLVTDSASHPEFDTAGYYRILDTAVVSADDPRLFWRIQIVLPAAAAGAVDYALTVIDRSQDPGRTGAEMEAPPLTLLIRRTPVDVPQPSALFFSGPDAKASATGPDGALIRRDVTVAGWLTVAPERNLEDPATEDWHYDLRLDNDFIQRNYSALNRDLDGAVRATGVLRLQRGIRQGRHRPFRTWRSSQNVQVPAPRGTSQRDRTAVVPPPEGETPASRW